jgi:hypothetical protein
VPRRRHATGHDVTLAARERTAEESTAEVSSMRTRRGSWRLHISMTCGACAIAVTDIDDTVDVLRRWVAARALRLHVTRRRRLMAAPACGLRGASVPTGFRCAMAVNVVAGAARGIPRGVCACELTERNLCARSEMPRRIPRGRHDMALATREALREMRRVRGRRRRIAMARVARRRSVLVTRQAGGRGRLPAEVLAVAALTDRQVEPARHDLVLVVRRESRRMDALQRAVRTSGLFTLHGTTGE